MNTRGAGKNTDSLRRQNYLKRKVHINKYSNSIQTTYHTEHCVIMTWLTTDSATVDHVDTPCVWIPEEYLSCSPPVTLSGSQALRPSEPSLVTILSANCQVKLCISIICCRFWLFYCRRPILSTLTGFTLTKSLAQDPSWWISGPGSPIRWLRMSITAR